MTMPAICSDYIITLKIDGQGLQHRQSDGNEYNLTYNQATLH